MTNLFEGVNKFQRYLSIAQAIPVVGPTVFSPCKALLSVAQTVAGLAKQLFYTLLAVPAMFSKSAKRANVYAEQLGKGAEEGLKGVCSLVYSVGNMSTFGILGLVCETTWFCATHTYKKVQV